ncbi:MAG TPA: hypothetical protein VHB77_03605, partial [Planctomycetaceae bacterium]|nr:hypothetical protein [Planctomycetaceae bacterium]
VTLMVLGVGSPAAFCTLACVTTVAAGCRLWQVPVRHFWIAASVAAYLPYAIAIPWVIAHNQEMQELRTRYPEQSLAPRLAYESKAVRAQLQPQAPSPERIEPEDHWDEQINHSVSFRSYSRRERSLSSLFAATHADFVAGFVNAEGFGVKRTRNLPPRRKYIELPQPEPIPTVPEAGESAETAEESSGQPTPKGPTSEGAADNQFTQFHVDGVIDFVNPEGFGAVAQLTRVIGFQAHGFRRRPEVPQRNGVVWKIEELQLVSLLKHDEPVAYLSDNLPRMEELREAPTRPLNAFEQSALEELRSGEELLLRESPDTLEMLGALRAVRACAECHQVPERTLLGAFSYQLRRQGTRSRRDAL